MSEYKVGQTVWKIRIDKYKEERGKYSVRQNGIHIEETKILGISKFKIVLDDDFFTTLDKAEQRKDRSMYYYLDDISVTIRTNNHILDDGVFISLYSTTPPNKKLLNKMVKVAEKEIDKKYGFLFGGAIEDIKNYVEQYEDLENV